MSTQNIQLCGEINYQYILFDKKSAISGAMGEGWGGGTADCSGSI